ncbi:peptidase S24/S26A/S26B/S26C [Cyathus striatus]|nr:peptidase S24/S26A/S26B/S26C [Cyathus striatus]
MRQYYPLYWLPTMIVCSHYFYNVKYVSGRSMQPTLNPDSSRWRDIGIFNRFSVQSLEQFKRDDIVCLRSPIYPGQRLVKRILAVEGDIVKTLPPYPDVEVKVPLGHVWVEGDDHFNSDDSNQFGPVPSGLLESKLVYLIWPLDRVGQLRPPEIPSVRSDPSFRHAMAYQERQKARKARVIASA